MNNIKSKYDINHLIPGKLYEVIEEKYCDLFLWTNEKCNTGTTVPIGGIVMFIDIFLYPPGDYTKSFWLYKNCYGHCICHTESDRMRQISQYKLIS